MTDKIEQTIKLLAEQARSRGFLTYADMSKLMEDQFIPPDRMDQIFVGLEDAGIELVDDDDTPGDQEVASKPATTTAGKAPLATRPAAEVVRGVLPEKIDDPVRMYLTQMGEIPLLTREQEIFLAKSIEITRKRFRKTCMGSGICMEASIETLVQVKAGELAFDRTRKVNPNPKPDDDPKIVETLGKQFLAKRLPVNLHTIERLYAQLKELYAPSVAGHSGRGTPPTSGPPHAHTACSAS